MISYIQYPKVGSKIPSISCIVQFASRHAASPCSSSLLAHIQLTSTAEQPLCGSTLKRHRSCNTVNYDSEFDTQPEHTPQAGISAIVSSFDTACAPTTPKLKNVKKHKSAATSERPTMITGVLAQQRQTHGSKPRQRTWPLRREKPKTSAYLEARDFLHKLIAYALRLNSGSDVLTAFGILTTSHGMDYSRWRACRPCASQA